MELEESSKLSNKPVSRPLVATRIGQLDPQSSDVMWAWHECIPAWLQDRHDRDVGRADRQPHRPTDHGLRDDFSFSAAHARISADGPPELLTIMKSLGPTRQHARKKVVL